jgi:hypothetical protein
MGPITPILMVFAPQAGKHTAMIRKHARIMNNNDLDFFMTDLLLV